MPHASTLIALIQRRALVFAFNEFQGTLRVSDLHDTHFRHSSSDRILYKLVSFQWTSTRIDDDKIVMPALRHATYCLLHFACTARFEFLRSSSYDACPFCS